MKSRSFFALLLCAAFAVPLPSSAQDPSGIHDFDWDIGTWKIHQHRLLHPLTQSNAWAEYDGTDVVSQIWDGANMGKIETTSPTGKIELYTLRLYDPDSRQWRVYFTNSAGGPLSLPVVGEFKGRVGEFYDQEPYHGRDIMVRFRVHDITPTTCVFDQSFSTDGGKTWEINLVVNETKL